MERARPRLKLYNSLGRKVEDFKPIDPDNIRVYACGPTVYNYAHIGNGRMAVVCDLLIRTLRLIYPKVTYVSNITDIDDKIMKASEESGKPIGEITQKFERIYNEDMALMGVQIPDIQPRATEHVEEMIELILTLVEKGHAYVAEDHVLFNVPSFPAHGQLSGRNREEQIAGSRVEVAPFKKDPSDFVLWKPSEEDQPGWDSPWGYGRPGWHLECSAMAEKHLGLPFDIHAGGMDLKFPHHENEIAQSCCAHDSLNDPRGFVHYWFHNGFVTMGEDKMSKSLGNIQLVHELVKEHPGEVLRMALLSAHYRQPLSWNEAAIIQAKNSLDRLYRLLKDLEDVPYDKDCEVPDTVLMALCDDLNTPNAFAELNKISNLFAQAGNAQKIELKSKLIAAANLLGILQESPDVWLGIGQSNESISEADIEELIEERKQAKFERDYEKADEIRDFLRQNGIEIEDTAEGTVWRSL